MVYTLLKKNPTAHDKLQAWQNPLYLILTFISSSYNLDLWSTEFCALNTALLCEHLQKVISNPSSYGQGTTKPYPFTNADIYVCHCDLDLEPEPVHGRIMGEVYTLMLEKMEGRKEQMDRQAQLFTPTSQSWNVRDLKTQKQNKQ